MLIDYSARELVERAAALEWERASVVNAAGSCLSKEDACAMLNPRGQLAKEIRRALLRKITHDMKEDGIKQCHLDLLDYLIETFPSLSGDQRQRCAYYLATLYNGLPLQYRLRILRFFLSSRFITVRRRSYQKARADWDDSYQALIKQAWRDHSDPECAVVIVERFEVEYLVEHLDALISGLSETWQIAQLFLRVGQQDSAIVSRLAEIDEISFVYVRAKLGLSLSKEQAIEILERNVTDPRVGLLIWAYGQMRLVSVLRYLIEHAESYEHRHMEAQLESMYVDVRRPLT